MDIQNTQQLTMSPEDNTIKIPNRLLTRLLISHILIVAIPLFITGRFLIDAAQDSITETILTRNLEFANRSTRFIDLKLKTAKELIKSQAQFQSIIGINKSTQEIAIHSLISQFDVFSEVSALDTLGAVQASTLFAEEASRRISHSNTMLEAFKRGQSFQSGVYVSDERLPMLDIAEPIIQYNEIVGILYAVVDLKAMWNLVDENKIGNKGEAFIFDRQGVYIAHSDRKKVYSEARFLNIEVMHQIRNGKSGHMIYNTEKGVEMVAAYAPIGDNGWGAMLQQPTSEAFAQARRMRLNVVQFIAISVILASLLAYFYSKLMVKPVKQLVTGMERFAKGELHHRIEKVTDDEIGALAENFNDMAERLIEFQNKLKRTEVFETLSKLASVLSHEIRNPLNSMVINMQVLKRELSREKINIERVDKFYGILAAEIKRVDQLVTDFLVVARPPKTEKAEVAINELLDDVVLMQAADSLTKGIRIEREYDKTPINAHVDASKIRQVFLNLALNAIQSMQGGGKLLVTLHHANRAERAKSGILGRSIVISFSDTGSGINQESLERIFDFYYSTKDDGTGLGLAIVQQIIDEHQGKIFAKSAVGKGTTITVHLPLMT